MAIVAGDPPEVVEMSPKAAADEHAAIITPSINHPEYAQRREIAQAALL